MQDKKKDIIKKIAQYDGYTSSYDYTIYNIGFIFNEEGEGEDLQDFLENNYMNIDSTGMGGNHH